MCSIDEDGYTQNIFSLERPYNRQLDIVRLAFLEYTLSEYAYLSDDDTHEPARQRLQLFLETSNATKRSIGRAIYGSQSDCWQGQQNSLNRTLVETVNYQTLRAVNAETLMYVQILKAHYCLGILRDSRGKNRLAAVQNIYQHWHQHQDDADPIAYADLVPLLATHELTEEVAVFIDWLQSNLHRDYTNATLFGIRTTRGVGKIAEALASTEAGHDLARQALSWLSRMQYTNESMFHIPISVQDRFQHGFRHSYWDRDLWLDGSCHALLAICRILYFDRYTKHQQMCSLPHAD